jgi:hypothetical protein
LEEGDSPDEDF